MATVKEQIKTELKKHFDNGFVNSCAVWKGYDVGTNMNGWHYVPFGETARYLGKSLAEVKESLEDR